MADVVCFAAHEIDARGNIEWTGAENARGHGPVGMVIRATLVIV